MTAQLSREIVENLLQHNDESDSPANAEAWEVNALCRLALAGMSSEPVAWQYRVSAGHATGWSLWHEGKGEQYEKSYQVERRALYAAAPAPVAVPGEKPMPEYDPCTEWGYQCIKRAEVRGWNACRAAMQSFGNSEQLKAEPATGDFRENGNSSTENFREITETSTNVPVSQRYTLPDGWIKCSERLPGSQEWVLVYAKWVNQQVLCWDDMSNRWTDFEDQNYFHDMFSHWMPLPAAPEQEV